MFEGHDQAIHTILAGIRQVEPDALQAAVDEHRATGAPLAQVALDRGLLERSTLLRAVAEYLGCGYAGDLPAILPGEALALVEGKLARAYGVAPLLQEGPAVYVTAVDPFNPDLVPDLAFALGREVRVSVGDPERVQSLIRQHYGTGETSTGATHGDLPAPLDDLNGTGQAMLSEADIEQLAGQTPIIRLVNQVLGQAIRDRASDIHFEPFERDFKIRCRVDGTLRELPSPARHLALPVISRLKVLANLNIAERRLPQDGRIKLSSGGRTVDLRVSTLPTQFGESVVLRVLDQSSVQLALAQLGLPAGIQSGMEEIIRRPNGILLVTGPTGSGKTTTLYSCLKELNAVDAKLLTVEDPVEYEIDGVMQVPVNAGAGLTFASALRTFLRQDPDVVMVGEIRDVETARIAIQASLTGHLVLSTLHTNDAPSAMTRLLDMGIEPFLLASTVEAVLAQRLVRRTCQSCRIPFAPPDSLLEKLGLERDWVQGRPFFLGQGCSACQHTGYKGRTGLFEFMPMNDALRETVVKAGSLTELRRRAGERGMVSLRAAGVDAVLAGVTTAEEVFKYT